MKALFLKTRRNRAEAGLSMLRHSQIYQAIKEENETYGYPISALCKLGNVSRSAYYKWLHREIPTNELENECIAQTIERYIQNHQTKDIVGYEMIWSAIII